MTNILRILRAKEIHERYGLGKTVISNKGNPESPYYDPTFPAAVRLGPRAVGWYLHELERWAEALPRVTLAEKRQKAGPGVAARASKKAAKLKAQGNSDGK